MLYSLHIDQTSVYVFFPKCVFGQRENETTFSSFYKEILNKHISIIAKKV